MRLWKNSLMALVLMIGTINLANAGIRKIKLEYYGKSLQRGEVMRLKREIRMQHPHIRVRDLKLDDVVVVAKSKHGRGSVSLSVGGQTSYEETLPGYPEDFHDPSRQTFFRVRLDNPQYRDRSQGQWQLNFRGKIKVKRIVLNVRSIRRPGPGPGPVPGPGPGYGRYTEVGSMKAEKFGHSTRTFYPSMRSNEIRLRVTDREVRVIRAEVEYASGRIERLYSLEGKIGKQKARSAHLGRSRRISRIWIEATTNRLKGSRGRIHVELSNR